MRTKGFKTNTRSGSPIARRPVRTSFTSDKSRQRAVSNAEHKLVAMTSAIVSRANLFTRLGKSYDGDRDMYEALGYDLVLTYDHYWALYERNGLAKRIINSLVDTTWRGIPDVRDKGLAQDKSSRFTKAWGKLAERLRVWHYLTRLDKLAGIGRYAVLLMGFKDGGDLGKEVKDATDLLYLRPYGENHAEVNSLEGNVTDPRYNLPLSYKLQKEEQESKHKNRAGMKEKELQVHWTRLLHVADGLMEDDVYGVSRLKCVYNRLKDVGKIAGGSGEMFWRGAFPGYAFIKDPESQADQSDDDMEDEIKDWIHGLDRFMRLQGVKVQPLDIQVANPSNHMKIQLQLISGSVGIPLRILVGSERGELASIEDRKNWHDRVQERRRDFAEPVILRPFIDRCIQTGVLPPTEYTVKWSDLESLDDRAVAEVAANMAKAIRDYMMGDGHLILPPEKFLKRLGYEAEEIKEIMVTVKASFEEEEREAAEAAAAEEELEEGSGKTRPSTLETDYKAVHGHAKAKVGTIEYYFHNFATHDDNVGYQHCVGGAANPYKLKHIGTNFSHAISKQYARGHGAANVPTWFEFTESAGTGWWKLSSYEEIAVADVPAGFK